MKGSVERAACLFASITLLSVITAVEARSQSTGPGALLVLRTQASSIIEEGWPQLADSLLRPGNIWLSVEGGSAKRVVENAILEYCAQRGFRPQLSGYQESTGEKIQVTILEQAIQYRPVEDGASQREIRTAVEMRRIRGRDEQVVYAGPFMRRAIDTVQARDDGGLAELRNAEERSFVDRLMGPVLLISGAFLIVYLFFTVRN